MSLAAAGLFALGIALGWWWAGRTPRASGRPASAEAPAGPPIAPSPPPARRAPVPGAQSRPSPRPVPRLALVIDDLGRRPQDVERLAALGVPISFAVLPFESHTAEVVQALQRRGAEVLVHLPMEPGGIQDPGPGALRLGQSAAELAELTERAIRAVDGARGANNHMGSALSADATAMRAILGVVARRRLFYLDSRTSAASVAPAVAAELGVPSLERQVFLDATIEIAAIETQFDRWLELARTHGSSIAIGHPHAETLEVLARRVPRARRDGFRFVAVSRLLRP